MEPNEDVFDYFSVRVEVEIGRKFKLTKLFQDSAREIGGTTLSEIIEQIRERAENVVKEVKDRDKWDKDWESLDD